MLWRNIANSAFKRIVLSRLVLRGDTDHISANLNFRKCFHLVDFETISHSFAECSFEKDIIGCGFSIARNYSVTCCHIAE